MRSFVLRHVKQVSGEQIDLVVKDGRIAEITQAGAWVSGASADDSSSLQEIDCRGQYVSSGWIDLHVHAFAEFSPYGDEIDEIGVKQGVTTIVDAGSCGADQIAELAARRASAQTNLLAFLNISRIGLQRTDELSNMGWIESGLVEQRVKELPDFIVGLKARISQSVVKDSGIKPLLIARALSETTGLPLMVHIGSGPPAIDEVIALLEKKDIITHYLNGKSNNLFDADGNPIQALTDAIVRGVHLDVGHGRASFSFQVAEAAKRSGIALGTISTDIYRDNRLNGPVYSMASVLSKFLYLGYSLEEVIAAVTDRAANWLGRPELGRIQVGDTANLTMFRIEQEPVTLIDSEGEQREAKQQIITRGAVADGNFYECEIRA